MIVNRPRGKFTLETIKTERVDSDTATKIAVLENELEKLVKAKGSKEAIAQLERQIASTRESGLREYPFLATKDCSLDRMCEFLASQAADDDNYTMFQEAEKIVKNALKVKFQQWYFGNAVELEKLQAKLLKATDQKVKEALQADIDELLGRDNEADFLETLEDTNFSGRKETPKSLMAKAMKLFKSNPVEASALLARAQEMISNIAK